LSGIDLLRRIDYMGGMSLGSIIMMRWSTLFALGLLCVLVATQATEASIYIQSGSYVHSGGGLSCESSLPWNENRAETRPDLSACCSDLLGQFVGDLACLRSGAIPSASADALAGMLGVAKNSDPPAAVVWSLLAICATGAGCGLPRRVSQASRTGASQVARTKHGADRGGRQNGGRRGRRAAWPEHVRAAILQIIARDSAQ
jgi:hypothetical protein